MSFVISALTMDEEKMLSLVRGTLITMLIIVGMIFFLDGQAISSIVNTVLAGLEWIIRIVVKIIMVILSFPLQLIKEAFYWFSLQNIPILSDASFQIALQLSQVIASMYNVSWIVLPRVSYNWEAPVNTLANELLTGNIGMATFLLTTLIGLILLIIFFDRVKEWF